MASSVVAIPLGWLYMRGIQRWVASLGLDPCCHGHHRVWVSTDCSLTLCQWRSPGFLTQGVAVVVITILARKVITTDASLVGWGATHEGRTVNGRWDPHIRSTHINCLELLAVHLALKPFLPWLRGHHFLVRTAYINRQGGLRSPRLHTLAHRPIVWSSEHLQSLRATHVPGILNCGADLLSRGNPLYTDWRLHPEVVDWDRGLSVILVAPRWPGKHWLAEIFQLLSGPPWLLPLRRDLLSQARGEIFHPPPHPHPQRG